MWNIEKGASVVTFFCQSVCCIMEDRQKSAKELVGKEDQKGDEVGAVNRTGLIGQLQINVKQRYVFDCEI